METAINYFAVFGGLDIKIDTTKPLRTLILRHILTQYYELHDLIAKTVKNKPVFHKILTGVALGDRRVNSAFKRAKLEYEEGIKDLYELEELKIISTETSLDFLTNQFEENNVADKIIFSTPFLRFWFAFVSPLYRGIAREEYDESIQRFDNYQNEFMKFVFEQLCHEYVKVLFKEDEIEEIGRYWDEKKNEIDLLAQTQSGRIVIGSCRYTNSMMKTNELNRLKDLCQKLEIVPDYVILFSKRGFTNKLKALKGLELRLFNAKSMKGLLK